MSYTRCSQARLSANTDKAGSESSKRISSLAAALSDGNNNAKLGVAFDSLSNPDHIDIREADRTDVGILEVIEEEDPSGLDKDWMIPTVVESPANFMSAFVDDAAGEGTSFAIHFRRWRSLVPYEARHLQLLDSTPSRYVARIISKHFDRLEGHLAVLDRETQFLLLMGLKHFIVEGVLKSRWFGSSYRHISTCTRIATCTLIILIDPDSINIIQ
ncbi:hypothetical protein IW262DRAFT_1301572 [Armillaria fumosa]|nr:hypothetical protein IW262DRAFT_1301572 [Armillaria fumosa]